VSLILHDKGALPLHDDIDLILLMGGLWVRPTRGIESELERAVREGDGPALLVADRPFQHLFESAAMEPVHGLIS
jgi:hypothetical protein